MRKAIGLTEQPEDPHSSHLGRSPKQQTVTTQRCWVNPNPAEARGVISPLDGSEH